MFLKAHLDHLCTRGHALSHLSSQTNSVLSDPKGHLIVFSRWLPQSNLCFSGVTAPYAMGWHYLLNKAFSYAILLNP